MAYGDPITAFVIPVGVPTVIAQTNQYALPSRACLVQSSAVLETSLDGSTWAAVTATTTGTVLGACLARCTSGTATVLCKLQ